MEMKRESDDEEQQTAVLVGEVPSPKRRKTAGEEAPTVLPPIAAAARAAAGLQQMATVATAVINGAHHTADREFITEVAQYVAGALPSEGPGENLEGVRHALNIVLGGLAEGQSSASFNPRQRPWVPKTRTCVTDFHREWWQWITREKLGLDVLRKRQKDVSCLPPEFDFGAYLAQGILEDLPVMSCHQDKMRFRRRMVSDESEAISAMAAAVASIRESSPQPTTRRSSPFAVRCSTSPGSAPQAPPTSKPQALYFPKGVIATKFAGLSQWQACAELTLLGLYRCSSHCLSYISFFLKCPACMAKRHPRNPPRQQQQPSVADCFPAAPSGQCTAAPDEQELPLTRSLSESAVAGWITSAATASTLSTSASSARLSVRRNASDGVEIRGTSSVAESDSCSEWGWLGAGDPTEEVAELAAEPGGVFLEQTEHGGWGISAPRGKAVCREASPTHVKRPSGSHFATESEAPEPPPARREGEGSGASSAGERQPPLMERRFERRSDLQLPLENATEDSQGSSRGLGTPASVGNSSPAVSIKLEDACISDLEDHVRTPPAEAAAVVASQRSFRAATAKALAAQLASDGGRPALRTREGRRAIDDHPPALPETCAVERQRSVSEVASRDEVSRRLRRFLVFAAGTDNDFHRRNMIMELGRLKEGVGEDDLLQCLDRVEKSLPGGQLPPFVDAVVDT